MQSKVVDALMNDIAEQISISYPKTETSVE